MSVKYCRRNAAAGGGSAWRNFSEEMNSAGRISRDETDNTDNRLQRQLSEQRYSLTTDRPVSQSRHDHRRESLRCKKYPHIRGYFVASFPCFNGTSSACFSIRKSTEYEVRAHVAMNASASLFRRFTDTNVYGTGFVKIRQTRRKNIGGYADNFLQCSEPSRVVMRHVSHPPECVCVCVCHCQAAARRALSSITKKFAAHALRPHPGTNSSHTHTHTHS